MPALDSMGGEEEPDLVPFRLNRLMAAWNARLEALLAERGAGFAQWRVLMVAARAGSPLTIVELAAHTLVPHSTLSRQIAAMERDGLLRRGRHAADGRAVSVELTARGRARYREWLPLALEEAEAGLAALDPAERALLLRLIDRLEGAVAPPQTSASIA
ncbi:MarR family winged helix-turn-helix transcriptional regulator [Muricoccus aerilatus]|uniref:MarR family winged helix-turn-helix transcriptional regulator n=1 Tax=Muricoccus aerilatus TaxID=452982 RepID=UPI000694BAE8|nr:MarR family transcriptional regulator [Roseomonas aerilata]